MQVSLNSTDGPSFVRTSKPATLTQERSGFSLASAEPPEQPSRKTERPRAAEGDGDRQTTESTKRRSWRRQKDVLASVEMRAWLEIQPNKPNPDAAVVPGGTLTKFAGGGAVTAAAGESPMEGLLVELVYELALHDSEATQAVDSEGQTAPDLPAQPNLNVRSSLMQGATEVPVASEEPTLPGRLQDGQSQDPEHQHREASHAPGRSLPVPPLTSTGKEIFTVSTGPVSEPPPAPATSQVQRVPQEQAVAPRTVTQLALEVGNGQDIVHIQVQQNAETIRVGVYSADDHLAPRLHEALPDLLKQLEQKGFESRILAAQPAAPTPEVRTETANDSSAGFQHQPRDTFQRHQERRRLRKDAWDDLVMQLHYE